MMRKQKASETPFLSILGGFGKHLGPPKRSQDAPKSMLKGHQKLISFGRPLGTRLFRPKRRQDAPAPQIAAEDGVGPGLLGKDLGWGNKNLSSRTGRYQELGFGRTWKFEEDLHVPVPHAVPGWAAD